MTVQNTTMSTLRPQDLARFDQSLEEAAATRLDRLERPLEVEDDPVAKTQRAALRQTLTEIVAARERIAAGTYGACTACHEPISPERLDFRPWAATCVRCASR